ncbi:hypothetical protein [Kingella potus]|uniref:hypothetical protein n=1 Tax=Kingella potus TaxID=265175 RepID=UPI001FD0DCD2|nr:hypothetical protein [Kingella potus]UOP01270.1 hypothetical protein LVJ84_03135 [Kingella potus]
MVKRLSGFQTACFRLAVCIVRAAGSVGKFVCLLCFLPLAFGFSGCLFCCVRPSEKPFQTASKAA